MAEMKESMRQKRWKKGDGKKSNLMFLGFPLLVRHFTYAITIIIPFTGD